jgi:hypothetical protein
VRRFVPLAGALAVGLVAVVVAAAALGGDGAAPPRRPLARAADRPIPDVRFAVVGDELHAPAGVTALPPVVRAAVVDVLERYVQLGSLEPMRRGRIGRGLDRVFAPEAFARASGPDRPALFDEGAPVDPEAVPVRAEAALVGLADPAGDPAAVVVRIVVQLSEDAGAFTVMRAGELTLVPAGDRWVVDGYSVRVTRTGLATASATTGTGSGAGSTGTTR